MMVSTTFYLTAAAQRIWISTTPEVVALDSNNVQKLPLDITVYAGEGIDKSKYPAYLTLTVESVVNGSVTVLYKYDSPSRVSSYSYSVPSDKYPTANRISVAVYQDDKRAVLIDSKSLNIVADNPVPFPRAESWSSGLVYKNGEYLMVGDVLYMWGSRVPGNTATDPRTWIQNNPSSRLWVPYPYNKLLAAQILLANFALVGSAVFDGDYMYSQQGVNASGGPTSDYRKFGTSAFTPNFSVNLVKGILKAVDAELSGTVNAKAGKIGIFELDSYGYMNAYANNRLMTLASTGLSFQTGLNGTPNWSRFLVGSTQYGVPYDNLVDIMISSGIGVNISAPTERGVYTISSNGDAQFYGGVLSVDTLGIDPTNATTYNGLDSGYCVINGGGTFKLPLYASAGFGKVGTVIMVSINTWSGLTIDGNGSTIVSRGVAHGAGSIGIPSDRMGEMWIFIRQSGNKWFAGWLN